MNTEPQSSDPPRRASEPQPCEWMRRDRFRHITRLETRWADMDWFKHINNVQYARYFESARMNYFNHVINLSFDPDDNAGLIIAQLNIAFIRQVEHPAMLNIGTAVNRIGNASIRLRSAIFAGAAQQPAALSEETVVWFNYPKQCSEAIPDRIRALIQTFEQRDV